MKMVLEFLKKNWFMVIIGITITLFAVVGVSLSQHIEFRSPYVDFPFGSAKPALIIAIVYIFVLAALVLFGKKTQKLTVKFNSIRKMKCREKNKFIFSLTGFNIMLVFCIVLKSFFDEENLVLSFSEIYLQYEILIFFGVFIFLIAAVFNKLNPYKQISVANKFLNILIWLSISTGLISGQMDYTFWQNMIVIICSEIIIFLFLIFRIEYYEEKTKKPDQSGSISYSPVKYFEDLFPQHRIQANDIAQIICRSDSNPFSICISGKWGMGKTSVVYCIKEKLKKEYNYEVICINALELDNKEAMMQYLFLNIREILKSRGVYVGIDSEFKDFLSSSAGVLTSNSIGAFIHKKFFCENDDYRHQKEELEKLLNRTLRKEKLVVIVDDIERCDKKIAKEYLFLIKEVATMENCVSVFVTDYDMLNHFLLDEATESKLPKEYDFLSKFFNYRVDLRDELPESIFEFYDNSLKEDLSFLEIIERSAFVLPKIWYQSVDLGMHSKLEIERNNKSRYHLSEDRSKEFDDSINKLEEQLVLFNGLLKNPRNVVKFYEIFKENIFQYDKRLSSLMQDEKFKQYIDTRHVGAILYFLSFAETFLPIEYQSLIEDSSKYINSDISETISKERSLLLELFGGTVYGEYSEYQKSNEYIKKNSREFLQFFLRKDCDLRNLINPFFSYKDEWIEAINKREDSKIEAHWDDMVLMVLEKDQDGDLALTDDQRNTLFSALLNFAEECVKNGKWGSEKIFLILANIKSRESLYMIKGILTTFWKHLEESSVYKKLPTYLVHDIKAFPYAYVYNRMGYIYRMAHYLIPYEKNNEETKNLQELLLKDKQDCRANISCFLDNLVRYIPNFTFKKRKWDEKYRELSKRIIEYLKQENILQYPDVKIETELMEDSIDEILSLQKIWNWVKHADAGSNILPMEFTPNRIEQIIQYFEDSLHSNERDINKSFSDFFQWLQHEQDIPINQQQLKRLHNLIAIYAKQTGYSSLPYRRVLLSMDPYHPKNELDNT